MSDEPKPPGIVGFHEVQTSIDSLKNSVNTLTQEVKLLGPALKSNLLGGNASNAGQTTGRKASSSDISNMASKLGVGGDYKILGKSTAKHRRESGDDEADPTPGGGKKKSPVGGRTAFAGVAAGAGYAAGSKLMGAVKGDESTKVVADTVMAQLRLSGISRDATKDAMKGDVTSASAVDSAAGHFALARQLNIRPGGTGDAGQQAAIGVGGAMNSGRTDAQTVGVSVAINQNMMRAKQRGMGINTSPGGAKKQDPQSLAYEILQKIPNWQTIDTKEKISQELDEPNGNINLTLLNWEANGYLPQGSVEVIKEQIRSILTARLKGMGYNQLRSLGEQSRSKDRSVRDHAKKQLKHAGVYEESVSQAKKESASGKRDRDLDLTDAYSAGVRTATEALTGFTSELERITSLLGDIPIGNGGSGGAGSLLLSGGIGGGGTGGAVGGSGPTAAGIGSTAVGGPTDAPLAKNGSNAPAGAPGTRAGAARPTGSGKTTIKFIKPVDAPMGSPFGPRRGHPAGSGNIHTGVDFPVKSGTPVHASAAGKVTHSGSGGKAGGWAGNWVMIDHGGGIKTLYAHMSRASARVGSTVQQGAVIGASGSTGRSTGPHLHFEIHIGGKPVNPARYLSGAGIAVDPKAVTPGGDPATPATSSGAAATAEPGAATGAPGAAPPGGSSGASSGSIFGGWSNPSTEEINALAGGGGMGSSAPAGNTGMATQGTAALGAAPAPAPASSAAPGVAPGAGAAAAPTSLGGNKALGKTMAAARGWTGREWDALYQLWMGESGWNDKADNPTSSAYGIPQALTRLHFKDSKKLAKYLHEPAYQITWGMDYIKGKYGTPSKALSKWKGRSPHWYDKGAWEIDRDQEMIGHKGEMVIPALPAKQIRDVLLNGTAYGANKPGSRGGGLQITIEKGAITVQTNAGVTSGGVADLGKAVANALAENDKIKRLQAGVLT